MAGRRQQIEEAWKSLGRITQAWVESLFRLEAAHQSSFVSLRGFVSGATLINVCIHQLSSRQGAMTKILERRCFELLATSKEKKKNNEKKKEKKKKFVAYVQSSKNDSSVFEAHSSYRWFRVIWLGLYILSDSLHIEHNKLGMLFDACVLPCLFYFFSLLFFSLALSNLSSYIFFKALEAKRISLSGGLYLLGIRSPVCFLSLSIYCPVEVIRSAAYRI